MAFERSESIVKSVRPCTLLTANFGKTKISLLHGIYRHPWRQPLFSRMLSHKTMFFFYFAFMPNPRIIGEAYRTEGTKYSPTPPIIPQAVHAVKAPYSGEETMKESRRSLNLRYAYPSSTLCVRVRNPV